MAYLGVQADNPELAAEIQSLIKDLASHLKDVETDVKVNAVVYLAAVYLGTSDVTREQALEMFGGLLDAIGVKRQN